jgi:hypothetical protein
MDNQSTIRDRTAGGGLDDLNLFPGRRVKPSIVHLTFTVE